MSFVKVHMEGREMISVDVTRCRYVADMLVMVRRAFGLESLRLLDIQLCDFGNPSNLESVCFLDPFLELVYVDLPLDVVLSVVIKPASSVTTSRRQESATTKKCLESLMTLMSLASKEVARISARMEEPSPSDHIMLSSAETPSTRSDTFMAPSSATIRFTDEELVFLKVLGQIMDVVLLMHEVDIVRPTSFEMDANKKKIMYLPENMRHLEEMVVSVAVKSDIVEFPGKLMIRYLECSAFETSILE